MDFIEKFRQQMAFDSIVYDGEIIADGELHRIHIESDSSGSKNGWYVVHQGIGILNAAYGCWKRGISEVWSSKSRDEMLPEEWNQHRAHIDAAKEKHVKAQAGIHSEAREKAVQICKSAKPANERHGYFIKKGLKQVIKGVRVNEDGNLVIPVYDTDKVIHGIQYITPRGDKFFLEGTAVKGHYFSIGQLTDTIYLGEGLATCATVHFVTGCGVIVAFNSGNLLSVGQEIRKKYPNKNILIISDNDQWPNKLGKVDNVGLKKAEEAGKAINAKVICPDFSKFDISNRPTDLNDLMLLEGVAEVKRQLEGNPSKAIDEWPEPVSIQSELLPVESLPIEIIPEPFRDFVNDVAESMQCPLDYIAVSLLTVTSSVIGAGCCIKPKKEAGWLVTPNLWGCVVGKPGKIKTPPVVEAMRFLDVLETDAEQAGKELLDKYCIEMKAYNAKQKAIESQLIASEKNLLEVAPKPDKPKPEDLKLLLKNLKLKEPQKPVIRRFKTNDATIEKLGELLAENSRGMMVYRDELMGLLKAWDKIGHEGDRSFYLEGWNGNQANKTDRIFRGTIKADNVCISVFGTIQPDRLVNYLYGAIHGDNDGLTQRFQMLVYPDAPDWRLVDKRPDYKAKERVSSVIKKLSNMDFVGYGATKGTDDKFPYFHFDSDAQAVFFEWLTSLEKVKLCADDHSVILEHLSKYRKLMPALALIFYLIDLADGKEGGCVSADHANKAAAWCEYLETHARRIYGLVTDIEKQAAAVLAKKLEQGKLKDGFTVRSVYRLKGLLKKKDIAQAACDELVEDGWLREVVTPPAKGQKEVTAYLVNPKIKQGSGNGQPAK